MAMDKIGEEGVLQALERLLMFCGSRTGLHPVGIGKSWLFYAEQ